MLTVEQIEHIRQAYYRDHKSVRAIAREQQHGRRAVREAIAETAPAPRHYQLRVRKRWPVLDPVVGIMDAWLRADQDAPRKQRHSAKRVYDRLVAEHGFGGSERRVREYVHAWKQAHRSAAVGFVPLAYAPGAEAQCDWGEALVEVAGVEQTANLFCMRLCYSLQFFVCAFPTTRQECFFTGHVGAFAQFQGVPQRVTYDNLSTAVKKVLAGRNRVEQEAFIAFRGHYLFDTHFCLPGIEGAHEKPLAETLVGYARRNFLVPVPTAPSWEALNHLLAERCRADDARTVAGRPASIGRMAQDERAHLLAVQRHAYPCCRTVAVRATRLNQVIFERNRYSVPSRYAGAHLLLRAFAWHVEISDGQTLLTQHARLYGHDGEQFDPLHYLPVLERKPGAFEHARPIQQWARTWPPIFRQYLAALRQARPAGATREFIRILQLRRCASEEELATALEHALARACFSAEGVEQLVRQALLPAMPTTLLDLAATPTLAPLDQVHIPLPDLQQFERLLEEFPS
jgi:transposase